MIKFTAILPFTAGLVQSSLKNGGIGSVYAEDGEGTGELTILQDLTTVIGPEDVILIKPAGDPIVITRTEFYKMEVI